MPHVAQRIRNGKAPTYRWNIWHLANLIEAAKADGYVFDMFGSNEHVYQQRGVFTASPDGEPMVIEPGDIMRLWREPNRRGRRSQTWNILYQSQPKRRRAS